MALCYYRLVAWSIRSSFRTRDRERNSVASCPFIASSSSTSLRVSETATSSVRVMDKIKPPSLCGR